MRLLSAMITVSFCLGLIVCTNGCGGTGGPEIFASLNVRDLCQKTISGEDEARCKTEDVCESGQFCWRPDPPSCSGDEDCPGDDNLCVGGYCEQACTEDANCDAGYLCTEGICLKRGYCRECQTDGNCAGGEVCDHGWCHVSCSTDSDCQGTRRCTAGVCRTPHVTEFSFCNYGSGTLEIYTDQTVLYGNDDACAYSGWNWVPAGEDTVSMAANECTVYLQVMFTPDEIGDYFGYMEIHSNSTRDNPYPLVIHGQVVEAECSKSLDAVCEPPCTSSEEDYQDIISNKPQPSCD